MAEAMSPDTLEQQLLTMDQTPTPERSATPDNAQSLPVITETSASSRESSVEKECDSERHSSDVERAKLFGEEVQIVKGGLSLSQAEVESAMVKVC